MCFEYVWHLKRIFSFNEKSLLLFQTWSDTINSPEYSLIFVTEIIMEFHACLLGCLFFNPSKWMQWDITKPIETRRYCWWLEGSQMYQVFSDGMQKKIDRCHQRGTISIIPLPMEPNVTTARSPSSPHSKWLWRRLAITTRIQTHSNNLDCTLHMLLRDALTRKDSCRMFSLLFLLS